MFYQVNLKVDKTEISSETEGTSRYRQVAYGPPPDGQTSTSWPTFSTKRMTLIQTTVIVSILAFIVVVGTLLRRSTAPRGSENPTRHAHSDPLQRALLSE